MSSREPEYLITQEALTAIEEGLAEMRLISASGSIELTKFANLIRSTTGRSTTRQALNYVFNNIGGRSVLLSDMLKTVGRPIYLASAMADVDRLILDAAYSAGIERLTPEQQKRVADRLKEQIDLMVKASSVK